ncbi:hypothetical protein J6590_039374 [Homalodisca vitripennis]|nr:hypothetical protein J6590_039374 [Homalodisca vitripennis]
MSGRGEALLLWQDYHVIRTIYHCHISGPLDTDLECFTFVTMCECITEIRGHKELRTNDKGPLLSVGGADKARTVEEYGTPRRRYVVPADNG